MNGLKSDICNESAANHECVYDCMRDSNDAISRSFEDSIGCFSHHRDVRMDKIEAPLYVPHLHRV